jgi:hypothetical protein
MVGLGEVQQTVSYVAPEAVASYLFYSIGYAVIIILAVISVVGYMIKQQKAWIVALFKPLEDFGQIKEDLALMKNKVTSRTELQDLMDRSVDMHVKTCPLPDDIMNYVANGGKIHLPGRRRTKKGKE